MNGKRAWGRGRSVVRGLAGRRVGIGSRQGGEGSSLDKGDESGPSLGPVGGSLGEVWERSGRSLGEIWRKSGRGLSEVWESDGGWRNLACFCRSMGG